MPQMDDLETSIYEWAKENAEKSGYRLNPDYDIVVIAIKGLAHNKRLHGKQYCSCRELTGNIDSDRMIICPCVYRKSDIERRGACKCALFIK